MAARTKYRTRIAVVGVILFFFLAPVVPNTVSSALLLPKRNQCFDLLGPYPRAPTQVFTSISYVIFGLAIGGRGMNDGFFGLVYVPNNGAYTLQFPPVGFQKHNMQLA